MQGQELGAQLGKMTPQIDQPPPFDPVEQKVATHIGEVPFTDLMYRMQESRVKDTLVVAREWFYTGNDPVMREKAGDSYVKRDVWVTILIGKSINGQQGSIGG